MKIIVNNNESQIEARHITIALNEDLEFRININQFGELTIQKTQYGAGESSMIIKPSVSNEIRIS
jgi:hypothetical protein